MASIFNLPSDVKQLQPVNRGMSNMNYLRVSSDRNARGASFNNGDFISFKFTCNGTQWWQPSKSYLRLDLQLLNSAQQPAAPSLADDIALNMGVCGSLFKSAELLLGGRTIHKIGDHLSEIDALTARMNRSRTWLANAGDSINYWESDYKKRQADVASDGSVNPVLPTAPVVTARATLGYDAANTFAIDAAGLVTFAAGGQALPDATLLFNVGDYLQWGASNLRARIAAVNSATELQLDGAQEVVNAAAGAFARVRYEGDSTRRNNITQVCWTPPLAPFGLKHCLPAGDYELKLEPRNGNDINNVCIESASGATGTVEVKQIFFNANIVDGDRVVDKNYIMDLDVISASEELVQSADLTQYNFNVAENTHGLTMAVQDTRVLSSTLYPVTKFKVGRTGDELKLNRMFIQYANKQFPQPDSDPTFFAGTDRTVQRYVDTQLNIGAMNDSGSPETIEDWHDRGAYYSFRVVKDGSDRSTRAVVNAQFSGGIPNSKILLFAHHKQAAFVSIRNGTVFNVDVRNI